MKKSGFLGCLGYWVFGLATICQLSTANCAHAGAVDLLAFSRGYDPSRMTLSTISNKLDFATAFVGSQPTNPNTQTTQTTQTTSLTAVVWGRWRPRAAIREAIAMHVMPAESWACMVTGLVSAEPARATTEGGATLPNLCPQPFTEPLTLVGGQWSATILPTGYDCPAEIASQWQYGCYTVNIITSHELTLTVAGATRTVAPSVEMQSFNIVGVAPSRAVSVEATSSSAQVYLGVAVNPLVQFFGGSVDHSTGGSEFDSATGGFGVDVWRMAVMRAVITNGAVAVTVQMHGLDARLAHEQTVVKAMDRPRGDFATNARVRFLAANVHGGMGNDAPNPDEFDVYGLKLWRSWLTDAQIDRIRALDAAEIRRRGLE